MELFFQEYGRGFPLVILHGLLGSLDNWHSIARLLGAEYRVFAVDQRNHGRSPHSEEFNYEAMVGDLEQLLSRVGTRETHLLGHSMGGKTAMKFALDHPGSVRKLIVVDIAPRSYPPHHDHLFDALSGLDLTRFESRKQIDDALVPQIPSTPVRQFLMKNLRRDDRNAFFWKMNLPAIERHYDEVNIPIDSEKTFEGPTLFLRGTQGDYVMDSDFPSIKKLFPTAVVESLNTGHWVHAEAPEEFSRIVMDFLADDR